MTAGPCEEATGDVRVLVVDDHALVAESLTFALRAEGLAVSRCPGTSADAVRRAAADVLPRLVLLDLDLGDGERGEDLIPDLTRGGSDVLVVTGTSDLDAVGAALEAGAVGWVAKSAPFAELVATAAAAARGETVCEESERRNLIAHWRANRATRRDVDDRLARLTPREREVLTRLANGERADAVAGDLVVSLATVRSQIRSILTKLQVTSQLAAVSMANHAGLAHGA